MWFGKEILMWYAKKVILLVYSLANKDLKINVAVVLNELGEQNKYAIRVYFFYVLN